MERTETTDADSLIAWAAQGKAPTYTRGAATVVAAPGLAGRDQLAVTGPADDLAVLVPEVLDQVGPGYRLIGDADTVRELAQRIPALTLVNTVSWMETCTPPPPLPGRADWLTANDGRDIAKFIDAAWPSAQARPGVHGVRRWAGSRDGSGRLTAVAADAWSAPTVGFLGATATRPDARGRGYATATCGFLLDRMISDYGRAALIVDGWNCAAIRLYRRLGLRSRQLATARVSR